MQPEALHWGGVCGRFRCFDREQCNECELNLSHVADADAKCKKCLVWSTVDTNLGPDGHRPGRGS